MKSRPMVSRNVVWMLRSEGSAVAITGVPNRRLSTTTWCSRDSEAGRSAPAAGSTP